MGQMPYVRCVGIGTDVYQNEVKKAYDWRMICVICGEGSIEIENKKYIAKANTLYVIKPGAAFRVCSGKKQKIAVVNFDVSYEHSYIKEPVLSVDAQQFKNDEMLKCSHKSFLDDTVYTISASDTDLFEEMYQVYLRDDLAGDVKDFVLSSKFAYIMSKALCGGKKGDNLSSLVYKYIVDNVYKKLTAESVARHFNYSASYIEKILRRSYNISFRQLIIETRLKKALWLLENTSLSCSEISSRLGFYSSQHFTQMFRKKYGKNPTDFRQKIN